MMTALAAQEAEVRPIWPDELERVQRLLPMTADPAEFHRTWLWAIAGQRPERLVGAAALHERRAAEMRNPPPPGARFDLAIKPAWVKSKQANELIAMVLSAARGLDLARVELTLDPKGDLAPAVAERGFVAGPVHEVWKLSPQEAFDEHGPVMLRGLLRRQPAAITPLRSEDLESVRALFGHHRLLTPDRVAFQPDSPAGFDPRFSFVFKRDGRVAAALLCRQLGAAVYLEAGARYSEVVFTDSSAVVALAYTLLDACARHAVPELICLLRPAATPELVNLMKRVRGRCIKRSALFVWPRPSPNDRA